MERILPIITILRKPSNVVAFAVIGTAFFSLNYYALANLPASRDFMCLLGGNLTFPNLFFSALISITIALLFAGLLELRHQNTVRNGISIGSASGVGIVTGTLTSFCTLCALPIISLFGIGTFFALVVEYQLYLKILSLVLLGTALY